MKDVDVRDTRNFALVGHAGDGKTSVGEALLHRAGAVATLGEVAKGTSVFDYQQEEKERGTSISSSVYAFDWSGRHLTLVDTPGDPSFIGDGEIAVQALDGVVLVVSAADGAKVGTERMWRAAERAGCGVLAFVSGVDRERADLAKAVESLRKLEIPAALLALPIGEQADFQGVIDLLHRKALMGAEATEQDIPADQQEAAASAREALVEAVAECDDALLEKYLEEGELSDEEIAQALSAGVRERKIVPVLCGSGVTEVGIDLLLRSITELLPSPADRGAREASSADGDPIELAPAATGPLAASVLKTMIDRYAGTLSVLRIVSGTLHTDDNLLDPHTGSRERAGKLFLLHGAEHVEVPEAGPGDIVALTKLKDVHTGDALTTEKGGVTLAPLTVPQGVLSYAIQAKSKGDEDKVYASLGRLVEEDRTLQLGREASTGEFLLTGMGELHIRTTVQKLRRMFGVEVELKTPKVPYRETLTRRVAHVEGKLKKQTGGKGMFGVCYLDVEPRPRGSGFEFEDAIVGGAIPRGLIPAVEKGVREALDAGPLAGFPMVDVKVRCVDGKHHSVDSNEMAFKLAGSFGMKAAAEQAKPTLLEPVMNVEVTIPDEFVGDIMGDLSSRRGRVQSSEARGNASQIKAQVPMAEMLEYASALTSMTGGKGAFHMEFSHYDEVPAQVREKVLAEVKAAQSQES